MNGPAGPTPVGPGRCSMKNRPAGPATGPAGFHIPRQEDQIMTTHIARLILADLARHLHAAHQVGIFTWLDINLVDGMEPVSRPPCHWADDAALILTNAQRAYETRDGLVDEPAPVLVFIDESAYTPRYAELLAHGETRNVKLVLVSRDETETGQRVE